MPTFYFGVTYCVYRALGLNKSSFWEIVAMQSLLYMAVSFLPVPGTAGVAEGGFYLLFKVIFSNQVIYATLLWRLLVYYLGLLLGGILVVLIKIKAAVK
ncbi:MAG: flippase-like domain-containing protein [Halanaerobiales bacterium]|nr:flippase-like domain-containing protein [Halanaerobiales bacterium]